MAIAAVAKVGGIVFTFGKAGFGIKLFSEKIKEDTNNFIQVRCIESVIEKLFLEWMWEYAVNFKYQCTEVSDPKDLPLRDWTYKAYSKNKQTNFEKFSEGLERISYRLEESLLRFI